MKRKIIQIADSTQLVSLPRKWALAHDLKKGNELEVTIKGDLLEVSAPGRKPTGVELEADISSLTPFLADRFMARAYQKGYDKIILHFKTNEVIQAIQQKIPELLGFEILNRSQNTCIIQSITSQLDVDFKTLLRRAFLILVDMSNILHDAYKSQDFDALKNITFRDYDVNKFCYFCLRSINKGYHNDGIGTTILYYQIENLEDLGDEFKRLGIALTTISAKNKLIQQLLNKTQLLTKECYDFFYNPSSESAVECISIYKEITALLEENLGTSDKTLTRIFFSLMNIARILYHVPTMRLDSLSEIKK